MNDPQGSIPHFLRVVRAIAKVRGGAIPLSAVTTVVVGVYCGCAYGSPPSPANPPHCTTNGDCLGGYACYKSVCLTPVSTCTKASDCSAGEVCDTAAAYCLLGGTSCKTNADCSALSFVCAPAAGICVEDHGPCASDADCSAGEKCDTSAFQPACF